MSGSACDLLIQKFNTARPRSADGTSAYTLEVFQKHISQAQW
ncbi:hypothetical protein [Leptolyngbya sp. GGD]|nr:hypothetical protein [Leptolyngbya sp. GGD]MCY6492859.1 hypothetical protein [Leptolyngbya sp. GGD]